MKTGKIRFRQGKKGILILQIEETFQLIPPHTRIKYEWRDAKVTDLSKDFMPIIIQKEEVI